MVAVNDLETVCKLFRDGVQQLQTGTEKFIKEACLDEPLKGHFEEVRDLLGTTLAQLPTPEAVAAAVAASKEPPKKTTMGLC